MAGLRDCVRAAAAAVETSRDELSRLDAAAGDGDHGVTMALAARAVRSALDAAPDLSGGQLVTKLAMAMGSVGGAIGPIYATGLLAISAGMRQDESTGIPTVGQLASWIAAAEAAIVNLGKAGIGDKTILDALDPALKSLQAGGQSTTDLREALGVAAAAAEKGALETSAMLATIGRASRLGERSRGTADPGATSFAIILRAMSTAYIEDATQG